MCGASRSGKHGRVVLKLTISSSPTLIPPAISLEPERLSPNELVGSDRWADELLDVFDDKLGAAEMADERGALRVIHRVGHVAHEHDVLAVLGHLPQAKRSAENAHVGVDADQDDIAEAALFEQVPD